MLAIYTRLSRESEDSNSIENQIREGKQFAKDKGFEYKIYNEGEGISGGAEIKYRPQLEMMLADMTSGKITAVYTRKGERIARNVHTWYTFADLVKEKNIEVYYQGVLQQISTPDGTLFSRLLSDFNTYTIDKQSYLTKRSLLDNVLEGKAHGKSTPLGYKADAGGYIVIDETEKPIVEKIYEMCLDGKGSTTIKHYLNNNNVPTRYSKKEGTYKVKDRRTGIITNKNRKDVKWSDNQVQAILKNPMYKGKRKWNDQFVDCPAIFNELYWQKVQHQYNHNARTKNTGKKVDHKYLLKGLLECDQCNRNYYGRTRVNKRDNYYMCSSKRYKDLKCTNRAINIDVLDDIVWNVMYDDNLYHKIANSYKQGDVIKRRDQLKLKVSTHNKEIENLSKQHKRTIDLVLKGLVDESEITESKKRIARETLTLNEILEKDKEELRQISNENKILTEFKIDWGKGAKIEDANLADAINQRLTKKYRQVGFMPSYNEKKRLLQKYVKRIFINYNHIARVYSIRFCYNLPIKDEVHLVDANYIFTYDVTKDIFDETEFYPSNKFTDKKKQETVEKLRGFSVR
ncbi:recombinase family protein [uncultured Dokdonia sp.]|uniref:recombinase family protein n=1 Tax=uncultured Dokdonia sp. TaxID=575653 RepID=UPI00263346AC|nr:recombinase family protein [uncultured Dokdonia sp.]